MPRTGQRHLGAVEWDSTRRQLWKIRKMTKEEFKKLKLSDCMEDILVQVVNSGIQGYEKDIKDATLKALNKRNLVYCDTTKWFQEVLGKFVEFARYRWHATNIGIVAIKFCRTLQRQKLKDLTQKRHALSDKIHLPDDLINKLRMLKEDFYREFAEVERWLKRAKEELPEVLLEYQQTDDEITKLHAEYKENS